LAAGEASSTRGFKVELNSTPTFLCPQAALEVTTLVEAEREN